MQFNLISKFGLRFEFYFIPFAFENALYILPEFLNNCVKNTHDSLGYPWVLCLVLKKFCLKSNKAPSIANGIINITLWED